MGFVSTLAAVFMTAYFQRRAAVRGKLMESKIQAYGDCAEALFEYHRATFNRVKARLEERPDRDELRQEAYRSNSRARSAIGRIAILSKEADLRHSLTAIRESIGDLNNATDVADLKVQHKSILHCLTQAFDRARADLGA